MSPNHSHPRPLVALIGAGEIGKEIAMAIHRLGVPTIALDSYPGAPAQQVCLHALTVDLCHTTELALALQQIQPTHLIPEIEYFSQEAIHQAGCRTRLFPQGQHLSLSLDKQALRQQATEEWHVPTARTLFVTGNHPPTWPQDWPFPCLFKPVCSSSGKGHYLLRAPTDWAEAILHAQEAIPSLEHRYLIEEWIDFDQEITAITIQQGGRILLCPLIEQGHQAGKLSFAQQPARISTQARQRIEAYAQCISQSDPSDSFLSIEFFVKGDQVWFSELAARPHDSGFLTLYTQNISQFDLYARSLLGLPLPQQIAVHSSYTAFPLYTQRTGYPPAHTQPTILTKADHYHLFNKPIAHPTRRMGYLFFSGSMTREQCQARATRYAEDDPYADIAATSSSVTI